MNSANNKLDKAGILERIALLKSRESSGDLSNLEKNQRYLYDVVKKLSEGKPGLILKSSQIKFEFSSPEFDFRNRKNVITDFCYNKVNKEDNENKFMVSPKKGHFQFVGFKWNVKHAEIVTWHIKGLPKAFDVGRYKNGRFTWDFDRLEHYILNDECE